MGAYDQYNKLTAAEKAFVRSHPFAAMTFKSCAQTALKEAATRYPTSVHNGKGDAFRHCYWNALMTRKESAELAKEFADAHETGGGPAIEGKMDLWNNAVGRGIGAANSNADDTALADRCETALKTDQLLIIDKGVLVKSNSLAPAGMP